MNDPILKSLEKIKNDLNLSDSDKKEIIRKICADSLRQEINNLKQEKKNGRQKSHPADRFRYSYSRGRPVSRNR